MAIFQPASSSVLTPDGLERIGVLQISADFMPLLGVQPMLGRPFVPEEDQPGSPHVAILGYATWTKYFNGDPDIIGHRLNPQRSMMPPDKHPDKNYKEEMTT